MRLFLKKTACGKCKPKKDRPFSPKYFIANMRDRKVFLISICFRKFVTDTFSCAMFSALSVSIDFQWMSSEKKALETMFQKITQFHHMKLMWQ